MSLDLVTMLKHRQDAYDKASRDLLTAIAPVLAGIVTFFCMIEEARSGQVEWKEIHSSPNPDYDEDLIIIAGKLTYKVGDMFKLPNGQAIPVTTTNQEYLNRIFRVGIPISIVENPSEKDTLEFLKSTEENKKHLNDDVDVYENEDYEDYELDCSVSDFDMDELTPSQRESYLMFLSSTKKHNE